VDFGGAAWRKSPPAALLNARSIKSGKRPASTANPNGTKLRQSFVCMDFDLDLVELWRSSLQATIAME
jgi:hypothetical protein